MHDDEGQLGMRLEKIRSMVAFGRDLADIERFVPKPRRLFRRGVVDQLLSRVGGGSVEQLHGFLGRGYSSSSETTNSSGNCGASCRNCNCGRSVSPDSKANDFTCAGWRRAVSTELSTPSAPAPPTPIKSRCTPGCEARYSM